MINKERDIRLGGRSFLITITKVYLLRNKNLSHKNDLTISKYSFVRNFIFYFWDGGLKLYSRL
jgi:hypothetical protein